MSAKELAQLAQNPIGSLVGRRRRTFLVATAAVLLAGVAAGVATPVHAQRTGFSELKGRWQRPDGGYILEIRAIDTNGKIDAAYLNPQPINVANAQATIDGTALKVFIELRAPNYPGSTYTLSYDRKLDQLQGVYFQAALQQNFTVAFVRMK